MTFLLDTQLLLWAAGEPRRLSSGARKLLADPAHDLLFSAVSVWEIVIKRALDRPDLVVDPHVFKRGLTDNGYGELPVTSAHALAVDGLPPLHRDPFDRMLIAQATVEGIVLLTHDSQVAAYPGPIRRV